MSIEGGIIMFLCLIITLSVIGLGMLTTAFYKFREQK